jgi:hypothetical protein
VSAHTTGKRGFHLENLLCPFGFWGFSLTIESPASAWDRKATVRLPASSIVTLAKTEHRINQGDLEVHLGRRQGMFHQGFPNASVNLVHETSKLGVRRSISQDQPVVYFFCHGVGGVVTGRPSGGR